MIEAIKTKEQSVELFRAGYFGNRVRQWNTLEELDADPFDGLVVLRQRSRPAGGRGITIYDIEKKHASKVLSSQACIGQPISSFYFNEAIIPSDVLFQGEICRTIKGLYLLYSTLPMHMHDALLKEPKHAFGLKARLLMEYFLDSSGLICIYEFLERFDDHVVEFTCCSKSFGDLGWRTIIWECRGF